MNLTFENKYCFTTFESVDAFRGMIEDLSNERWYENTHPLKGYINEKNEFQIALKNIYGPGSLSLSSSFSLLSGKIMEVDNFTKVEVNLKQPIHFVLGTYSLVILVILTLADALLRKVFPIYTIAIVVSLCVVLLFIRSNERRTLKMFVNYFYLKPCNDL
jgi:hypothetical protein